MEIDQREKEQIKQMQKELEGIQTDWKAVQAKFEELQIQNTKLQTEQNRYAEQFLAAVKRLAAEQQEIALLMDRLKRQEEYTKKILQILNTSEKEFTDRVELLEYKYHIREKNAVYERKAEKLPEWFFFTIIRR